jgi:hypothetical protein
MRPSCLDCCRKHLAQAEVLMLEARKGYVVHSWLAVGHLAEAEDETLEKYPEISEMIRNERLKYIESLNNISRENYVETFYNIDTLSIIEKVTDMVISIEIESNKVEKSSPKVNKNKRD